MEKELGASIRRKKAKWVNGEVHTVLSQVSGPADLGLDKRLLFCGVGSRLSGFLVTWNIQNSHERFTSHSILRMFSRPVIKHISVFKENKNLLDTCRW